MRTVEYSLSARPQCAVCCSVQFEHNSAVWSAAAGAAAAGDAGGKLGQWRRLGGASTCQTRERFQELHLKTSNQPPSPIQHVSSLHNWCWYWFCGDLGGWTDIEVVLGGEGWKEEVSYVGQRHSHMAMVWWPRSSRVVTRLLQPSCRHRSGDGGGGDG